MRKTRALSIAAAALLAAAPAFAHDRCGCREDGYAPRGEVLNGRIDISGFDGGVGDRFGGGGAYSYGGGYVIAYGGAAAGGFSGSGGTAGGSASASASASAAASASAGVSISTRILSIQRINSGSFSSHGGGSWGGGHGGGAWGGGGHH